MKRFYFALITVLGVWWLIARKANPLKGIEPLSAEWLASHTYETGKDGDQS